MGLFNLRLRLPATPPESETSLLPRSMSPSTPPSRRHHGSSPSSFLRSRAPAPRRGVSRKPLVILVGLVVAVVLLTHHSSPAAPHAEHLIQIGKQRFENALNSVAGPFGEPDGYESDDEIPPWWIHTDDDEDSLGLDGSESAQRVAKAGDKASWFAGLLSPLISSSRPAVDHCAGWDPDAPEGEDPVRCLRARQYRQVQRVLERELLGKHEHWYFTRDYNLQIFRNISRCFLPDDHEDFTLCPPKPLILDGWWYSAMVVQGGTSGETIWEGSLRKQYAYHNISVAVVGPYENWIQLAEMMPDVYRHVLNVCCRMVLAPDVEVVSCITDPRCVAKEHYVPPVDAPDLSIGVPDEERGVIPIWAIQIHDYWGCRPREIANSDYYWAQGHDGEWSFHPLGLEWVATPWPLPSGHVHLPYSIEAYCLPLDFTPHDERDDMVLILAKRSSYFYYSWHSPISFWTALSEDPSFRLVSTADIEEGKPLPDGLSTIGGQTREQYEALVGSAKVMLGIGQPMISPSVYSALCQGTPVVLPVFDKDHEVGGWFDFQGWSQHSPAALIGEPYVYSYDAYNYTDLEAAVHRALNTSIDRYIPPDMRWTHCLREMKRYLNRDMRALFRRVVEENGGKVPALYKGGRERCYELGRCRPELPAGRKPSTPQRARIERQAARSLSVGQDATSTM